MSYISFPVIIEQCQICGLGTAISKRGTKIRNYRGRIEELEYFYLDCDTCGTCSADKRVAQKNVAIIKEWRDKIDKEIGYK